MLADIVGSTLKGGANNHHKFFRYRDDVVGRRFGIVCIAGADRAGGASQSINSLSLFPPTLLARADEVIE